MNPIALCPASKAGDGNMWIPKGLCDCYLDIFAKHDVGHSWGVSKVAGLGHMNMD